MKYECNERIITRKECKDELREVLDTFALPRAFFANVFFLITLKLADILAGIFGF